MRKNPFPKHKAFATHQTLLQPPFDFSYGNAELEDLSNLDLRHVKFQGACLRGTNLSNSNLEGVNLIDTDLAFASFEGANLSSANLSQSFLQDTNFSNANLSYCNLSGIPSLKDASFDGANVDGVITDDAEFKDSVKNHTSDEISLFAPYALSEFDITQKIDEFRDHRSRLDIRLISLLNSRSSHGVPLYQVLPQLLQQMFDDLKGSILEKRIREYPDTKLNYDLQFHIPQLNPKLPTFDNKTLAEQINLLSQLNEIIGKDARLDAEIQLMKQGNSASISTRKIINRLNLTEYGVHQKSENLKLYEFLKPFTPLDASQFSYSIKKSSITSPQYAHLELRFQTGSKSPKLLKDGQISALFFALNILYQMADIRHMDFKIRTFSGHNRDRNAFFDSSSLSVTMDEIVSPTFIIHEVLHALEYLLPNVTHLVTAFIASRVKKEDYKVLFKSKGYGIEYAFRNVFFEDYAGKIYDRSSEFITTAIQNSEHPLTLFEFARKDYAHFLFIYAILTSKMRQFF